MKHKVIITTILLGLLAIKGNSYANTAAIGSTIGGSATESKLGKEVFKNTMKFLSAAVIYKNKGKILVGGIIVTGASIYGYNKFQYKMFKEKIANHKNHEQEWLNLIEYDHQEWIDFVAKIEQDYETTKDLTHKQNIAEFKKFVGIDDEAERMFKNIINSQSFYNTYAKTTAYAQSIEIDRKKQNKKCTYNDLQKLSTGTSYSPIKKDYSTHMGKTTPEFFVDNYGNLKNKYNSKTLGSGHGYDHDHIPSYKAVETFFINNGLPQITAPPKQSPSTSLSSKAINKVSSIASKQIGKKTNRRHKDLENSLTAITIKHETHFYGSRTYFWKNTIEQYTKDSNNLLEASILDIAFTTTYIENILGKSLDYYDSAQTLLRRNYDLCLYGPFK